jgi:hypothetical protein
MMSSGKVESGERGGRARRGIIGREEHSVEGLGVTKCVTVLGMMLEAE